LFQKAIQNLIKAKKLPCNTGIISARLYGLFYDVENLKQITFLLLIGNKHSNNTPTHEVFDEKWRVFFNGKIF